MALQSSQRLPELLFYAKKSYRILQLQLQLQSYKSIHIQPTCAHYTPENSPSRIQFCIQKTKSSLSTTTTFQRAKRPSFQKKNSTHRRQGDLLEIHSCVPQDIPGIPATRPSKGTPVIYRHSSLSRHSRHSGLSSLSRHSRHSGLSSLSRHSSRSRDIPDIPVIHDLPASPGNSTYSTVRLVSRKLHRVPVGQLQTLHSSKKGRCCDIGQTCIGKRCQDDIFPRI